MRMKRRAAWSSLLLTLVAVPPSRGADIDFYRDVYPVLKADCISCHNKTTTKGKLNMESPELIKKGGESGPGLVAGKSAESLIVQAAAHTDPDLAMPPKNNKAGAVDLTPAELDLLKAWIDQGAKHSVQQARQVVWQPLPAGVSPIYTVAMTRDGRFGACGRANQIFIYDLATREPIGRAVDKDGTAHRSLVCGVTFSPDGMRMASGSFREVKIWRQQAAAPQPATAAPSAAVVPEALLKQVAATAKSPTLAHALSADGKLLATGNADGVIRIWEVPAGKLITELRGSLSQSKQIADLEWAVGRQTLEQTFQKAEVTRIEAQNKSLDELLKKANDTIAAMKKSLPEKEKAVKPAQDAYSDAQKALAEVEAEIAKAPDGMPDAALKAKLKAAQDKVATTMMSETSVTSAFSAVQANIEDAQDDVKRITETKAKNTAEIAKATAAADAAAKEQTKATTDLAALKAKVAAPGRKPVAVTFSPGAQKVAALFEDGVLNAWAVNSGLPTDEAAAGKSDTVTLTASADGTFTATKGVSLATSAPGQWVLERVLTGDQLTDRVNAVRFSPDGKTLAVGGGEPSRSGDISLWEVESGKLLKNWPERHSDSVLCLDFSPDGKLLASGAADKLAKVTDVATGKQTLLFEGHSHHVMSLSFRADGRTLATAGGDGTVVIWDMIIGERKRKIEGWAKEVTSLQYIGATAQIVTAAGNNLVRIINDDGSPVRAIEKLPNFMQSVAATPNAATVIAGGEDSVLRMWDGTSGKELAVFQPK